MHKTTATIAGVALATALLLASCSSDDDGATKAEAKAKATTTTAGAPAKAATLDAAGKHFCQDVKAAFGDYQPNFGGVFANGNDHPTLADWAAFLPDEIKNLDEMITRLKAVEDPEGNEDLAASFHTAVEAFDTVSANFHTSLDTANAGDKTSFDAAERKNQDTDLPAMGKAMDDFKSRCGFPQD